MRSRLLTCRLLRPPAGRRATPLGTPDIVVSSVSSEEDPTVAQGQAPDEDTDEYRSSHYDSSAPTSPNAVGVDPSSQGSSETGPDDQGGGPGWCYTPFHKPLAEMDTLGLPGNGGGPNGLGGPEQASSRSCSVDLSSLRRDIELMNSVHEEGDPSDETVALAQTLEVLKTSRSKSHDGSVVLPASAKPSRLEQFSVFFRKALARSPVVRKGLEMQQSAGISEQKSLALGEEMFGQFWIDESSPSEHLWVKVSSGGGVAGSSSSAASASPASQSALDSECYLGERECLKWGDKHRCIACHVTAHADCVPLLTKMKLHCKTSCQEVVKSGGVKGQQQQQQQVSRNEQNQQEEAVIRHHWVHRWKQEGRCAFCSKSFQQKLFSGKEVIAISCSWCKTAYHNKHGCFSMDRIDEMCDRGILREIIVPPYWIQKLPNPKKGKSTESPSNDRKKRSRHKSKKNRLFVTKPVTHPNGLVTSAPRFPLLVFVNPKSGGNKGGRLLHTLCWLLNPRQVFDVMTTGPKLGLEMYRKVMPNLRVLICGGDGTVGWVLSTLDSLHWASYPPIAMLPLGTGNDLARAMGWGGTFSDEPMSELLASVAQDTTICELDRWKLEVSPNYNSQQQQEASGGGAQSSSAYDSGVADDRPPSPPAAEKTSDQLPLAVMNNYFSIGADAHVALQFHHSRSANPTLFSSRFRNRLAYGGIGTIDLFKRSWRDLADHVRIICDDVDVTPKVKEGKFHCLLFINIPFYAGGTNPWGTTSSGSSFLSGGGGTSSLSEGGSSDPLVTSTTSSLAYSPPRKGTTEKLFLSTHQQQNAGQFTKPSHSDGKVEVLGFTTATLATLHMGGRGERIAQCSRAKIVTAKPIPMQVDGEPCLMAACKIVLAFHSKVPMLKRESSKPSGSLLLSTPNLRRKQTTGTISPLALPQQHQQPVKRQVQTSVILKIPILVVAKADYDAFRYDFDKLKETGFEIGTVSVEAETDLKMVRSIVQRILVRHLNLPYEPTDLWRFLDYVSSSCAEEGVTRLPVSHEPRESVSDVCSLDDCLLIQDDAFPSMAVRSNMLDAASELHCHAASSATRHGPRQQLQQQQQRHHRHHHHHHHHGQQQQPGQQHQCQFHMRKRRVSETLRMVLRTENQEAHL